MYEYYFNLNLTENEHFIVEGDLLDFCNKNDLTLLYYRKLKTGHVPMWREVKVISKEKGGINLVKAWIKKEGLKAEKYIT